VYVTWRPPFSPELILKLAKLINTNLSPLTALPERLGRSGHVAQTVRGWVAARARCALPLPARITLALCRAPYRAVTR